MKNECSAQFERVADEAEDEKEFAIFKALFLAQFAALAERAGRYVSRMCNRDRGIMLENALTLAWTLREEFNPSTITLMMYWDQCLQGAVRMQKAWFVRDFDGWHRATSDDICSMFGLPAFLSEDV